MTPLSSDPAKNRQWQQKSQQRARERTLERMRERGNKLAPRDADLPGHAEQSVKRNRKPPKRDNLGPWRNEVMAVHGEACKNCGDTRHVEADHVIPRSQQRETRFDVENGLPLCGAFTSNPAGSCHERKTSGTLKFQPEWFTPSQLDYLAVKGWVDFDEEGQPFGRGYKHFEPRIVRAR